MLAALRFRIWGVCLLLSLCGWLGLLAQTSVFQESGLIPLDERFSGALCVATADLNRDGKPDIVIGTGNEIILFPGSGNPVPRPGRNLFTGKRITNVVLEDFDRDGIADMAAFSPGEGSIVVFKGTGDGNFTAPATVAVTPSEAWGIIAADFNQDGNLDLAAAQDNSIALLLGAGGGTFTLARELPIGGRPRQLVAADLNGDRVADLVTANSPYGDNISVLLGKGNGEFQTARQVSAQDRPYGIAVADFDRDSRMDLAVATFAGLAILLGGGDGTFRLGTTIAMDSLPLSIAAGDLNADGAPDVVLGNYYGGSISVVLNKGRGTFQPGHSVSAFGDIPALVLADLNADSRLDLIAASYSSATAMIAAGSGNGNFDGPVFLGSAEDDFLLTLPQPGAQFELVAVSKTRKTAWIIGRDSKVKYTLAFTDYPLDAVSADFDGDQVPDLAVAGLHALGGNPGDDLGASIRVFPGRGDGSLGVPVVTPVTHAPVSSSLSLLLAAGDFTGDGVLDVAVANNCLGAVQLYKGKGDGSFEWLSDVPGAPVLGIASADFDRDGMQDIAVGRSPAEGASAGTLTIYSGRRAGFVEAQSYTTCSSPRHILTDDLNGDSSSDLAISCAGDFFGPTTIDVRLNSGTGSFQTAPPITAELRSGLHSPIVAADFNGDGKQDLVALQGYTWPEGVPAGFGQLLLGNGDGTFRTAGILTGLQGPMSVVAVNWDGDGRPDLAFLSGTKGNVTILRNALASSAVPGPLAVVNGASMVANIAPDSIATLFGQNLSNGVAGAESLPLPLELADATVVLTDASGESQQAPLFYVSPLQINFLIPPVSVSPLPTKAVSVMKDGVVVAQTLATLKFAAPGVFTANQDGKGVPAALVLYVSKDNSQTTRTVSRCAPPAACVPEPIDLGGDYQAIYLLLFGTGIRNCPSLNVTIAGIFATVAASGPQGQYEGLDQVNILLPPELAGKGEVDLNLDACGEPANPVRLSFR